MSKKNNHNPNNIYKVSITNNKDELYKEWDFISKKRQNKYHKVQCICNNAIYAEINIYKNNKNNKTIFVGSGCKKTLELKNINKQKNIIINKYRKKYKYLNIDDKIFKNIEDFNKYEEYVIKEIYEIIVDELNKNIYTIKGLYKLSNEINIIFENKEEYNDIFILINDSISKEEKRLEEKRLEKQERLKQQRLKEKRLEEKRLEKQELEKQERLKQQRLEKDISEKKKLEEEIIRKNYIEEEIEKIKREGIKKKELIINDTYILIENMNINISSEKSIITDNIYKFKEYYHKYYKNDKRNYKSKIYIGVIDKILENCNHNILNEFKDFKIEELWPKIKKKIINP
jgi:hypothetical protein